VNLGVEMVDVNGIGNSVGGLVGDNGRLSNRGGVLSDCYSTGRVRGERSVGGLVGGNKGSISNSYSSCTVKANQGGAGGLVGSNNDNVRTSYSTGAVSGGGSIGGLVGSNDGGRVTTSYSTGTVVGDENVGGLVGDNFRGIINTSYSTGLVTGNENIGGLAGSAFPPSIINCIWDMNTSGLTSTMQGGVGLNTEEMMDPQMLGLNGFSGDPNWIVIAGQDYPRLAWEGTDGHGITEPSMDWLKGQGTAEEPHVIESAAQLILLGKASILWGKQIVLGVDIDLDPNLAGREHFYQAVIPSFTGVFDGNGHTLSNLTVSGTGFLGFFGRLFGVVKNLGIEDVNIVGTGDYVGGLVASNHGRIAASYSDGTIRGNENVGGLVGGNSGSITMSHSSGIATGSNYVGGLVGGNGGVIAQCYSTNMIDGGDCVGGLVGQNEAMIAASYSSGTVDGGVQKAGGLVGYNRGNIIASHSSATTDGGYSVGGLVGTNSMDGTITASHSTGEVNGRRDSVGGLVGWNIRRGTITKSYSTSTVHGLRDCVGGLVGRNEGYIAMGYSTGKVISDYHGGGLVGDGYGDTYACFWDRETSGQSTSVGGTGLTTTEMQDLITYTNAGWDFVDETLNGAFETWQLLPGDYPELRYNADTKLDTLDGSGTIEQPYLIRKARDLCAMWYEPEAHYQLEASVDLSKTTWYTSVIPWFGGTIDGNGHVISNLHIQGHSSCLGLFGEIDSASRISGLGLEAVDVDGDNVSTIGGLAGKNRGEIDTCYSIGTTGGNGHVGGLVGLNDFGSISMCYSIGTVTASDYVGGLVGRNDSGSISMCYSIGMVTGSNDRVGGLVGENDAGRLRASYSNCNVVGDKFVGGFVGHNSYPGEVTMSYSTGMVTGGDYVGGFVGHNIHGGTYSCFWDEETSGLLSSDGGTALPTAELQTANTFTEAGWDFIDETDNGTEDIWWIDAGKDYPRFWWELE